MSNKLDYVDANNFARYETRLATLYQASISAQRHLWGVLTHHYITEDELESYEPKKLSEASIIGYPNTGCYICETEWEPRLTRTQCPGEANPGLPGPTRLANS